MFLLVHAFKHVLKQTLSIEGAYKKVCTMIISRVYFFQFFPGSPSQEVLDFGTLGMGEKRDIYFAILNKNPIAVTLRGWGANLTGSLVEVIGVDQGNETEILERASFEGMTRKLIIHPGHYLIFRLGIHTTETEGAFDGYVYVETSYHTFKVSTSVL